MQNLSLKLFCISFNVLLTCEAKLHNSFPSAQFKIDRFSAPLRFERNNKIVGLLIYIWDDIFHLVSYFANCNLTL